MVTQVTAIKKLQSILSKDTLLTDAGDTWAYGYDNSRKHHPPDIVALPEKLEDICSIVEICYEYAIPITCRGRASGTTGGAIPIQGGLVLSLERFNKILDCDIPNRTMIVEAGVLNETVQQKAHQNNFFWAPNPSSAGFCTVGGNLACNAAGPRSLKYGSTRDNTLGLQVITGMGKLLHTGVHTTKGVVGYDFTRLLIGSEGTLGIIVQATLKLLPLPEAKTTLCAYYTSMQGTTDAILSVMAQSVVPSALEIMDGKSIDMIRNHQKIDLPHKAKGLLLIEVDGMANLELELNAITRALHNHALLEIKTAQTSEESKQFWGIRKALSPALRSLSPHKINEDVVVPVSNMPLFFQKIEAISEQYSIPIVNFGHGGNGNIHVNLLADPLDPMQGPIALKALHAVFDTVLELKGTLSGEHGVGMEKKDFIQKELTPEALSLMRQIKQVFDPKNILNPGKIFP